MPQYWWVESPDHWDRPEEIYGEATRRTYRTKSEAVRAATDCADDLAEHDRDGSYDGVTFDVVGGDKLPGRDGDSAPRQE